MQACTLIHALQCTHCNVSTPMHVLHRPRVKGRGPQEQLNASGPETGNARKTENSNDYGKRNEDASAGDSVARAEGKTDCGAGREIYVAIVYAGLSAGGEKRPRRDGGRRRRQRVSGFRGGDSSVFYGTLPPESGGGDSEAGRGTDSHVRHGFLLREFAVAGGAAGKDGSRQRSQESLFHQFRHGSG